MAFGPIASLLLNNENDQIFGQKMRHYIDVTNHVIYSLSLKLGMSNLSLKSAGDSIRYHIERPASLGPYMLIVSLKNE